MLNPFKKKDNAFKLDDYKVPSMSEAGKGVPESPSKLPQPNDLDTLQSSMQTDNSLGKGLTMPDGMPQPPQENPFPNSMEPITDTNLNSQQDIGLPNSNSPLPSTPMQNSFSGPIETSNMGGNVNGMVESNSSDIIRVKLEAIENKLILNEAKMVNIERKLDILYNVIMAEVSEETKKKYAVNTMMDSLRNRPQQ